MSAKSRVFCAVFWFLTYLARLHFADVAAAKNQHTIFVDTEEEVKKFPLYKVLLIANGYPTRKFDAVQYFDTPEELIGRRYNRPRISTLEKCSVMNVLSKRDVQSLSLSNLLSKFSRSSSSVSGYALVPTV
uniref:Uncharacterized protein n=1 Tax=Parascaris equorum TaxID=6256 RepID=A0A914RRE8_PAREQ